MKTSELGGVIVPAITPVDDEDRVDEGAYRKLLKRLIEAGVHGVFAGGSAGEGPLLVLREWERMASIAFEECHGKVHLLGGALDTSTRRIIERIKILARIGYENFVVSPTFYVGAKLPEEHLRLFGECKEHSEGMEMVAYNIPSCTGSVIKVETMCEMARRGWIRYCKESSEDLNYLRRLVSEGGPLGLRVLMGSEANAAQGLLLGACGIVPVCANYEPSTFLSAYNARADREKLMRAQERIDALVKNIPLGPRMWLAGVKYALFTTGVGSGKPVSPLEPVDLDEKRRIDLFLQHQRQPSPD
jgi:4-hydroxy-tetrahydrodipicolinate synthase